MIFGLENEAALFWVTAALVGVTIFYAIQTWKLVRVAYTPVLKASLATTCSGPNFILNIEIENIGVGSAVSISGYYRINKEPNQSIVISLLRPNERHSRIQLRNLPHPEDRNYYQSNPTTIKVELMFKDIFNHSFNYKESLDVSDYAIHFERSI